jgi:hypothetical protein
MSRLIGRWHIWKTWQIAGNQVVFDWQMTKPKSAHLSENSSFVGNSGGQNPIKGANAIGPNNEQLVPQIINVTHFTAPTR